MKKPTVEQRRTEILEVTCEVVIERGFAATRISDVAKRLDVSSSLIHYHFDSKEQLLAEAFSHYARKDLAAMEAEIRAAPTALSQLDRIIHDYVPEGSDDMEWMLWIDAWGEALRNPMMRTISQELDEHSLQQVVDVLQRGVSAGEFRCDDPRGTALRLTALIDGLAVQFAAHTHVLDRSQVIDSVRRFAASEIGVMPGRAEVAPTTAHTNGRHLSPATEMTLRQVVAQANDSVWQRDATAFSELFCEDGSWSIGRQAHTGRTAIAAALAKQLKDVAWIAPSCAQMLFSADEAAGTGTGRLLLTERAKRSGGKVHTTIFEVEDRYRRDADGWRILERRTELLDRD